MSTLESAGSNMSGMFSSIGAVAANYFQDKLHKKLDTDGDGTVGKSEFQAALQEVGVKLGVDTGSTTDADAMFDSVDADGNGSLTGSETGQIIAKMLGGGGTQAFVQTRGDETRFSELDADGDGNISMAEFGIGSSSETATTGSTDTLTSGTSTSSDADSTAVLTDSGVDTLMASVDSDGDGKVSGSEISAFAAKISTQMEAASKLYNTTATASFTTSQLKQAA
jgi:Ca2+-binding EF-hand superfamily protein